MPRSALEVVLERQAARKAAYRCACPCEREAAPKSKYYDWERCRLRAHRERLDAEARDAGLPTTGGSLTLSQVRATAGSGSRIGNGEKPRRARQARRREGLTIYLPTVKVAKAALVACADIPEARDAVLKALTRRSAREKATRRSARHGS